MQNLAGALLLLLRDMTGDSDMHYSWVQHQALARYTDEQNLVFTTPVLLCCCEAELTMLHE